MAIRQFQASIARSIKQKMETVIRQLGHASEFRVTRTEIICKRTGSVMGFQGVERNIESIRGWEETDTVILNEAQDISQGAWDVLRPTVVRNQAPWFYIIMNPRYPHDALADEFLGPDLAHPKAAGRKDVRVIRLSMEDNQFNGPEAFGTMELNRQEWSEARWKHVWVGDYDVGALHNPFNLEMLPRCWDTVPPHAVGNKRIASIDVAFTESDGADWTVVIVGDLDGNLIAWDRFPQDQTCLLYTSPSPRD